MADLYHFWGQDLTLTPQGGIALASGTALTQQNAVRRLMTTPGNHLYYPEYGAGLVAAIGNPLNTQRMQSAILKNLRLEPTVDQSSPMSVEVTPDASKSSVTVSVEFSDIYGKQSRLNLPVA